VVDSRARIYHVSLLARFFVSSASPDSLSGKILLVEDNEDDVFFFRLLARKAGIAQNIVVATDGEHALDLLRSCAAAGTLPLVTFIDLKLPKLFGFDVLKWMHGEPALAPMLRIVLTSSYEDRDVLQAYAFGANGYLVKYPTPADLAAVVHAAQCPADQRHHLSLPGVPRPAVSDL
jgi:two-component system response regulator